MKRTLCIGQIVRLTAILFLAGLMGRQSFDRIGARAPDRAARQVRCFTAEANTYVSEDDPTANFGTELILRVRETIPEFTYVGFDLSQVPLEAFVYSATLRLSLGDSVYPDIATELCAVEEARGETTVTYDTRPNVSETIFDAQVHGDTAGYKSCDATTLVQAWVDRARDNHGFALLPDATEVSAEWWSREEAQTVAPELCVDYDAAPVTNAMFELIPNWGGFDATTNALSGGVRAIESGGTCGWVENSQVTIEWGRPDFQGNHPTWTGAVDDQTGCFGPVTFNVPDFSLEEYTGMGFSSLGDDLKSAVASGFDCSFADGSLTADFTTPLSPLDCSGHRVYEVALDLQRISAEPGDAVRLGVRTTSASPAFTEDIPQNFTNDFTKLGKVNLAGGRLSSSVASGTINGISVNNFEIEVTQGVQDQDNSLSLAADKATVDEPLIWTMPVNEGTSQNPTLPNQGDIDRQEEEMLTLLPVPDATFARYNRQEIGAQGNTNMGNALTTIKNWYFD